MPPLRFGKREKLLLSIGAPALILVVFYLKVYEPKSKELKKAQDELALLKNQYQVIELQESLGQQKSLKPAEIARRLKGKIEQVQTELASLEENLPRKSRISLIFREITDLAGDCGVEIISFNPGLPQGMGMYEAVPIGMSLRAEYLSIVKFIEGIKKFPIHFDLMRLEAIKTDLPDLKVELKLDIYISGD